MTARPSRAIDPCRLAVDTFCMQLISIQIGSAKTYHSLDTRTGKVREWTSGIDKCPVEGPVEITSLGVAGDVQANRKVHGGIDKALLAYCGDHYQRWREIFSSDAGSGSTTIPDASSIRDGVTAGLAPGAFGENLTFTGLAEPDVCIGDRWRLGDVVVEVSQPRQPCSTLSRRWQRPTLVKEVVDRGWTGWYLRVITPGMLSAGVAVELLDRPHPEWPIPRAHRAMYGLSDNPGDARELAQLPVLSLAWREELLAK